MNKFFFTILTLGFISDIKPQKVVPKQLNVSSPLKNNGCCIYANPQRDSLPAFYKLRGIVLSDTIDIYLNVNTVCNQYFSGMMVNHRTGYPFPLQGYQLVDNHMLTDFTSEKLVFKTTTNLSKTSHLHLVLGDSLLIQGVWDPRGNFQGKAFYPHDKNQQNIYLEKDNALYLSGYKPICYAVKSKQLVHLTQDRLDYDFSINGFSIQSSKKSFIESLYEISVTDSCLLNPNMTRSKWDKVNIGVAYPYISFANAHFISGYNLITWSDEVQGYSIKVPFLYDIKQAQKMSWKDIATRSNESRIKNYLKKHQANGSNTVLEEQMPFITHKGFVWIHDPERITKDADESLLEYLPFSKIYKWVDPLFLKKIAE